MQKWCCATCGRFLSDSAAEEFPSRCPSCGGVVIVTRTVPEPPLQRRDLRDPLALGEIYLFHRRNGGSISDCVTLRVPDYRDDPEGANVKKGEEREALLRRFSEPEVVPQFKRPLSNGESATFTYTKRVT